MARSTSFSVSSRADFCCALINNSRNCDELIFETQPCVQVAFYQTVGSGLGVDKSVCYRAPVPARPSSQKSSIAPPSAYDNVRRLRNPGDDVSTMFQKLDPRADNSAKYTLPSDPTLRPLDSKPWKNGNHSNTGWKLRKHASTQEHEERNREFDDAEAVDDLLDELAGDTTERSTRFDEEFVSPLVEKTLKEPEISLF